jgi:hypothetical protein
MSGRPAAPTGSSGGADHALASVPAILVLFLGILHFQANPAKVSKNSVSIRDLERVQIFVTPHGQRIA